MKRTTFQFRSAVIKMITILYLGIFIWGEFIYHFNIRSAVWETASFSHYAQEFTNLVPFSTWLDALGNIGSQSGTAIFLTLMFNFLVMLPFGLLFVSNFPNSKFKYCALTTIVFLLCINVAKLCLRIGSFDIDDIVIGTLGAVLPVLVAKYGGQLFQPKERTVN